MGKAYYYTSATLPMLFYDNSLPVSEEDFLDICQRTLTDEDFIALSGCTISIMDDQPETFGFSSDFRKWEVALRNSLARIRAKDQGLDEREFLRPDGEGFGVDEIASAAVKIDSPLEAEHYLNRARWNFVEELKSGHIMDLEFLMGYYLQMQILARKESFQEEKGFQNYRKFYEDIMSVRKQGAENEVTE